MIKFRCPGCDQKLGVPDEYAGKRVKCSKCGQPCAVPAGQNQVQSVSTSQQRPISVGQQNPAAAKVKAPLQHQPVSVPVQKTFDSEFDEPENPFANLHMDQLAGGPNSEALAAARRERDKKLAKSLKGSSRSSGSGGGGFSAAGLAIGAGKIPLSLAASIGFMVGVCILWTVIASLTGMIFVYVAVGVAAAGAYGLVLFTEKRNAGFGVLAIVMALFGILIGKVMIAKWAVMPQVQKMISETDFTEKQTPFGQMSTEEQQNAINSPFLVYAVGSVDLWKNGQLDEFAAKGLLNENIMRGSAENETGEPVYETEESEFQAEHEAVIAHIANWNDQDKRQAFEKYHDEYVSEAVELIKNSNIMQGLGFVAAFIGAFSLWDLLIIPFSLITAYKIGAGTNS